MRLIIRYIKKYLPGFLGAIFFLTVESLAELYQPKLMASIVDEGVASGDVSYILRLGGIMLAIALVGAVGAVMRNVLASVVSQNIGRDMRSDIFRRIQGFAFSNIDKLQPASLMTRLTNDVSQVQNFINGIMRIMVKAPILCVGAVVMVVTTAPSMSGVLAVVIPVALALTGLSMKFGYPLFMRVQKAVDRLNDNLREYLAGIRVIKAFGRSAHEKKRFDGSSDELAAAQMKAIRVMALFGPGISLAVNLGIIAVLWIAGYRVADGGVKVGEVMAVVNYMTQLLFSLSMISMIFNTMVRALASAGRIGEVFDEKSDMDEPSEPKQLGDGGVDFNNVSFRYGKATGLAVKDFTFHAKRGQIIGVIGPTGSGKTTLVSLIPRFYDVTAGSVSVCGVDVREAATTELRSHIAVVPQKSVLFTGTIADNIRWGREDASDEEVREAARLADADGFISAMPEKYDTMLGQGGVNLSGGQKQRVAIARALIRRPDILILDDCTSALDVETEASVREAVRGYCRGEGLLCFLISQRVSSVINSDVIAVMEEGRAVGIGTHAELMRDCAVYKDIVLSQYGSDGARELQNSGGSRTPAGASGASPETEAI